MSALSQQQTSACPPDVRFVPQSGHSFAIRAAPPVALRVGVIDLTAAALTIWALVAQTQADQAKI